MKTRQAPLTLSEWQIMEVKKALAEADRGEFASDEEVARMLSKWSRAVEGRKPRN